MLVSIFASTQLLHVPDGFLSLPIAVGCWVMTLVVLWFAVRNAQEVFDERLVPMAGIMAAFIFAAQMLNFPVAGGTSGHFVGAALAAMVLGPWVGILVMTAVVVLQALLFQDGGLVVMGANILIMGIVPAFVGYGVYRLVQNRSRGVRLVGAGLAAWSSVLIAALLTALLLGFSGTSSMGIVLTAMLGVHAVIGLGEAVITAAALAFIEATRPQMLQTNEVAGRGRWLLAGLLVAVVVVLFAPLASPNPDGLEWVAEQTGFIDLAEGAPYELLPDYTIPGLGETAVSTILAGIVGVLLVAGVMYAIGRFLQRKEPMQTS